MPLMDWATQVKVVAGAACGRAYLHEDCKDPSFVFGLFTLFFHIFTAFTHGFMSV